MKYFILGVVLVLCGCVNYDVELQAHLEAELNFAEMQKIANNAIDKGYDPEYVDDCLYYEEIVCEFE